MARRSQVDAKKTRQQLLADAAHLFSTQGYSNTSVADICTASKTTKGALFHHFKSKQSLFLEIWTSLQVAMDAEAREAAIAARSLTDPYSAFLAGCRVYLKYATRRDYQKIVLIDGPSVLGMKGWYEEDHALGSQNVLAGVRYLAKKGIVAEGHVEALAVMLQSALNGVGFALSREEDGVTPEKVYSAFEAMVRSLR
jgi:AcrR family transcriptional regulator